MDSTYRALGFGLVIGIPLAISAYKKLSKIQKENKERMQRIKQSDELERLRVNEKNGIGNQFNEQDEHAIEDLKSKDIISDAEYIKMKNELNEKKQIAETYKSIDQLAILERSGAITKEEFESKKLNLLNESAQIRQKHQKKLGTVKINRESKWAGKAVKINVVLDTNQAGSLKDGETITLQLEEGEHSIYFTGSKSTTEKLYFKVLGDDIITIHCFFTKEDIIANINSDFKKQ